MTNLSPFESFEQSSPPDIGTPMENETTYENDPIGSFFIQKIEVTNDEIQEIRVDVEKAGSVDTIVVSMIRDLGLKNTNTDEKVNDNFVKSKVQTAFQLYNEKFWNDKKRLDLSMLQDLHDDTEQYEEQSTLLSTAIKLKELHLKTTLMMDAERVIRILIRDEAQTLTSDNVE